MPIFVKKFSSKSSTPRITNVLSKVEPIDGFRENIKLMIDHSEEIHFVDGNWLCIHKSDDCTDLKKCNSKDLTALRTQNSLYQIKIDILLDLLSEKMSESHFYKNRN